MEKDDDDHKVWRGKKKCGRYKTNTKNLYYLVYYIKTLKKSLHMHGKNIWVTYNVFQEYSDCQLSYMTVRILQEHTVVMLYVMAMEWEFCQLPGNFFNTNVPMTSNLHLYVKRESKSLTLQLCGRGRAGHCWIIAGSNYFSIGPWNFVIWLSAKDYHREPCKHLKVTTISMLCFYMLLH